MPKILPCGLLPALRRDFFSRVLRGVRSEPSCSEAMAKPCGATFLAEVPGMVRARGKRTQLHVDES